MFQENFGLKQKRVDVLKALHFYLHLHILPALKFPITTFTTNQSISPTYQGLLREDGETNQVEGV